MRNVARRTRKLALTVLAAGVAAAGLPAQAGVDPLGKARVGEDVPFASENVDILGTIPMPGVIGARFQGSTMYVTGVEGLRTFDVSDPTNPQPLGALPLTHFENEDVSVVGDTLVIAAGYLEEIFTNIVYVIDVTDPRTPLLRGVHKYGYVERAAGLVSQRVGTHTIECSPGDCRYAYISGDADITTIDTATGAILATWAVDDVGGTHDLSFDEQGYAWVAGANGSAGYRMRADMIQGDLIAKTDERGNLGPWNNFIHHNITRVGSTDLVLITEEDYTRPRCINAGLWETWRLSKSMDSATPGSPAVLTPIAHWDTSKGTLPTGEDTTLAAATCSSHWFTQRDSVAAVGWYEQGTRFLDFSDPANIRQIGYLDTPGNITYAVYFAPTDPNNEIVYAMDTNTGITTLRLNRTPKGSVVPALQPQAEANMIGEVPAGTGPHPEYGWGCRIRL